jgi:hypothetical protein
MTTPALLYASGSGERFGPALVLAAGPGNVWARGGPGGAIPIKRHKQLLHIPGDGPLICRTVNQCLRRGISPRIITPHQPIKDAIYEAFTNHCIAHFVDFLDVGTPQLLVETIAASARAVRPHELEGPIIGLLGDCFYSDDAMDQIVRSQEKRFFGRPGISYITGGRAELFAWTWNHAKDWAIQEQAIAAAIEQANADPAKRDAAGTPYGGLWQLYRGMVGLPLDSDIVEDHFVTIDDFTDDFDTPEEYQAWCARYSRRMISQQKYKQVANG